MRVAALVLILALAGCAPTSRMAPARAETRASARVDSLLALPLDTLTPAETTWLAAYAARRSRPQEQARQRGKSVFAVLGVGALVGAALLVYAVQDAAAGN